MFPIYNKREQFNNEIHMISQQLIILVVEPEIQAQIELIFEREIILNERMLTGYLRAVWADFFYKIALFRHAIHVAYKVKLQTDRTKQQCINCNICNKHKVQVSLAFSFQLISPDQSSIYFLFKYLLIVLKENSTGLSTLANQSMLE